MLPRALRLRHNREFKRAYTRGRSYPHSLMVLYVVPGNPGVTRFGFSVSRKLGGAVIRNRIRRRLREACRALLPEVRPGFDVVIVARRAASMEGYAALRFAIRNLLAKARLLNHEAPP
ncbi:MAG: ribonuclease P protein component [Chthonomonadales bacterium]